MINKIGLNEPSHNIIFINGVLYLFTGNMDAPSQFLEPGENFIEDIYMLDLSKRDAEIVSLIL